MDDQKRQARRLARIEERAVRSKLRKKRRAVKNARRASR